MTPAEMTAKFNKRLPLIISESGWRRENCDWFDVLSDTDRRARDDRSSRGDREFHYIRLSRGFQQVLGALLPQVSSFIDIGCGGGDKLAWVKEHYPHVDVYGVEHDPAMAIWASCFGKVTCADAFTIDYNPYGLIYAYWPIADRDKMISLIEHVLKTKRKESVFTLFGFDIGGQDMPKPSLTLHHCLVWQ